MRKTVLWLFRALIARPGFSIAAWALRGMIVGGWWGVVLGTELMPIQKLTNCDEAAFRTALEQGGRIQCDCTGTLVLHAELVVKKDSIIDCPQPGFAVSGDGSHRIFRVESGVSLSLLNLTIRNGNSPRGGGLLNEGGQVTVSNCVFALNVATGVCPPGSQEWVAEGGAVYNTGGFLAVQTMFSNNATQGPTAFYRGTNVTDTGLAGWAAEGGISQAAGTLELRGCSFVENRALGGDGLNPPSRNEPIPASIGGGGSAQGGGIDLRAGQMTILATYFDGNVAYGGAGAGETFYQFPLVLGSALHNGGSGGAVQGAAVATAGNATIRDCFFRNNEAKGGARGSGSVLLPQGPAVVSGYGGLGGSAQGGAVYNRGQLKAERCTWAGNRATGGSGGFGARGSGDGQFPLFSRPGGGGGTSGGGGVFNHNQATFGNCTWVENQTVGGSGANGGDGGLIFRTGQKTGMDGAPGGSGGDSNGGAVLNERGSITLMNCTLATNRCEHGLGGAGGLGFLVDCPPPGTSFGFCSSGRDGVAGTKGTANGGGVGNQGAGVVTLGNTLLASNLAGLAPANASGALSDQGHNLSSDATCPWTRFSSRALVDPKLGAFGQHGGLTPTLPLRLDSPARDGGNTLLGSATDQRGVVRPFGPASDIGAVEYEETGGDEGLRPAAVAGDLLTLRWKGGPSVRLQSTPSLVSGKWRDVAETAGKNAVIVPRGETMDYFRLIGE